MPRVGRYLRRTGRGTCPGLVASVIVNERSQGGDENDPRCRVRVFHSVNVAYSYHSRNGWTAPRDVRFGSTAEYWRWFDALGRPGRRVHAFAPIASDALTLLGFWERTDALPRGRVGGGGAAPGVGTPVDDAGGVVLRRLVLSGRPDVVAYKAGGHHFLWLSGRQFWDYPTADLSVALAGRPGGQGQRGAGCPTYDGRSGTAARIWLHAMITFADWWASLGAGPFPRTVPGGAMQFFRSRMDPKSIVVHRDEEPYRLERLACHGGRASCWYFGTVVAPPGKTSPVGMRPDRVSDATIVGPVYRLDVRSMYPSLLRDREYPVHLVKYSERWSVDDLQSLTRRYGVIADVELESDVAEYPHRCGDRVDYPVGRFRSVLCGPELGNALKEGAVRKVYAAANYEMGRPFAVAAGELCGLRQRWRSEGNRAFELLAKLLGNSLAGKLAQKPSGWIERPDLVHHPRWDVWMSHNADTGSTRRFRCIAGRVYEYGDIGVGQGCLTACFAFLTSYGRSVMRSYRDTCPSASVLCQDTDGLWVTAAGLDALRRSCAVPAAAGVGQLELKGRTTGAYWLGPKHYRTDQGWILSGFHSPEPPRGMLVKDSFDVNPVRAGCTAPPDSIRHFARWSRLPAPPPAGYIDDEGWAHPVRLPRLPGDQPPFPPLPPAADDD